MKSEPQIHIYDFPPDELWWGAMCAKQTIDSQHESGCVYVREDKYQCYTYWTRTGNLGVRIMVAS